MLISVFHNIHLGGTHSFFFLLFLKPPRILWSWNHGLNPIWLIMWQRLNFVGQNSGRKYQLIQRSLLMPFLQSCCFAILSLSAMCLWAFGKSPFVFPAFAISAAFFALLATPAHAVCSMRSGIRRKWRAHLSWGIEGLMRMPFRRMCSNWRDTDKVCWSLCGGHQ